MRSTRTGAPLTWLIGLFLLCPTAARAQDATPVAERREDTFEKPPEAPATAAAEPEITIQEAPPLPLDVRVSDDEVRPPSFPKLIWLDTKHVFMRPFHWGAKDLALFGASLAAIGATAAFDEKISDEARDPEAPSFGRGGDVLEGLGDGRGLVLLGGFYLVGTITKDRKAREVAMDGLIASGISSVFVNAALATVAGRERPTDENGAYEFNPFGGRSFPSGHVAQAFGVVSVIAASYDQWYVKVAAYGGGLFAAYARVRRGKHFASDVVAGAIIGTAVGHTVVRFNRKLRYGSEEPEERGARLMLVPVITGDVYGLTASLRF